MLKEKLTSRKFLVAVAGVLTGICLILSGETVEGAATVITSVGAYLIAEGYIDAKAVGVIKETLEAVEDKLEEK